MPWRTSFWNGLLAIPTCLIACPHKSQKRLASCDLCCSPFVLCGPSQVLSDQIPAVLRRLHVWSVQEILLFVCYLVVPSCCSLARVGRAPGAGHAHATNQLRLLMCSDSENAEVGGPHDKMPAEIRWLWRTSPTCVLAQLDARGISAPDVIQDLIWACPQSRRHEEMRATPWLESLCIRTSTILHVG